MKKLIENIKEYLSLIWPDILALTGSIILFYTGKDNFWGILWALSPFIVFFPIRVWIIRKRKVIKDSPRLSVLNEIRRIVHSVDLLGKNMQAGKVDKKDFDVNRVKNINLICEKVYNTMAGISESTGTISGSEDYCVIVSLVETSGNEKYIRPMYDDCMKMAIDIKRVVPDRMLMAENTIYKKIYDNYYHSKKPTIITTANIKQKINNGRIHSSITQVNGIGYSNFPYNSSCVFPILPFHNQRIGDEMQGFVTILSKQKNVFGDNNLGSIEINNKEFQSYLETLSGYYYKICRY